MKKIMTCLIIFFAAFVGIRSANAVEANNYWIRTHESNIELISSQGTHTLNLSNMIKDYYYIFYVKDLSDNDIDINIINATIYSPYSFSFRKFADGLSTTLDLDTVLVFKADESVVSIKFECDCDFKYAILEKY